MCGGNHARVNFVNIFEHFLLIKLKILQSNLHDRNHVLSLLLMHLKTMKYDTSLNGQKTLFSA